MLSELGLRNFKAFGDEDQKAPMSKITLIYGPNSGGKSSVIQALLLLKQSLDSEWSSDRRELMTRGEYVNLGSFSALLHKHEIARKLGLSVTFASNNKKSITGVHMTFVATKSGTSAVQDSSILQKIEYQIFDDNKALLEAKLNYKNEKLWDISQLLIANDDSREILDEQKSSKFFLPAIELQIQKRLQKLRHQSAQKPEEELQRQLILDPILELIKKLLKELIKERGFELILDLKLKQEQKRILGQLLGESLGNTLGQEIEQKLGQEYAHRLGCELVQKYIQKTGQELKEELEKRREQKLNREQALVEDLEEKIKRRLEYNQEIIQEWKLDLESIQERILKLEEEERKYEEEELKNMTELIPEPEPVPEEEQEMIQKLIRPLIWQLIRHILGERQKEESVVEDWIRTLLWTKLKLENEQQYLDWAQKLEDELLYMINMGGENIQKEIQEVEGELKLMTKLMLKLKPEQILNLTPSDIPQSYNNLLRAITYLGPLRSYPERLYTISGVSRDSVGIQGEFTPHILYHGSETRKKINEWFKRFDILYELKVSEFEEMQLVGKYVSITLNDKRTKTPVTLADVGFGINQVLPVIIEGVASPPNTIICVEQPEIHLHPRLQAELAEMIIETSKNGKQWIVETHSELLIRRIQRRIRGGALNPDDVSVLYVNPGDDGSKIEVLELDEDGDFTDEWPHGFFDEGFDELMAE